MMRRLLRRMSLLGNWRQSTSASFRPFSGSLVHLLRCSANGRLLCRKAKPWKVASYFLYGSTSSGKMQTDQSFFLRLPSFFPFSPHTQTNSSNPSSTPKKKQHSGIIFPSRPNQRTDPSSSFTRQILQKSFRSSSILHLSLLLQRLTTPNSELNPSLYSVIERACHLNSRRLCTLGSEVPTAAERKSIEAILLLSLGRTLVRRLLSRMRVSMPRRYLCVSSPLHL